MQGNSLKLMLISCKTAKRGVHMDLGAFSGGYPGLQVCEIVPLDPAEVRQDQSRVVGGDTGPSVAYASSSIA